ncbi:MAG: tetratricopeptide repeat protein [Treponema sp.]|jgi:tetratricopeptide (TPR) repeat protein|nr:tetratricopeptide repeat protein [Treponema sp.]
MKANCVLEGKMKKRLAAVMMILAAGFCFGQQVRVAVAPFTAVSGNTASDAETLSEIFGLELQAKNVVRVYTRGNIEAVMSENKFQMSDLSSDEKTASLGKAANADWVVRGQVQKLGAVIVVTASLLDVNTLEIMGGAPMYLNSIEEAAVKMDGFITTITQRLTGGSGGRVNAGTAQNAVSHLERGIVFFDRDDFDLALEEFSEAIKIDQNYAKAYAWRGRTYVAKGDNDAGIADANQAIRLDPSDAVAYFARGRAYSNKGDNDRTIADYSQAIRIDPDFAMAYYNRGIAYFNKRDYDRAITDYSQAIRIDPDFAMAYYNRGVTYDEKRDYDRAITDYSQAIRIDPNLAAAYYNRGVTYYEKRDYDRAITDYSQAIRIDPNLAVAYYNRGIIYYEKRDYDRAIADFTQALKIDPNFALAKRNLEIARKRGR